MLAYCERVVELGRQQGLQWIEIVGAVNLHAEETSEKMMAQLLKSKGLEKNRIAEHATRDFREFLLQLIERCMSELMYKYRGPTTS